jgi:hypothetical protein
MIRVDRRTRAATNKTGGMFGMLSMLALDLAL